MIWVLSGSSVLMFACSVLFARSAVQGVTRARVVVKPFVSADRKDEPLGFWFLVLSQAFFATVALILALALLVGAFNLQS